MHCIYMNYSISVLLSYHKITKISHSAYIFQRPFLRGLFLEELIFGEGKKHFKIDWASLIFGGSI